MRLLVRAGLVAALMVPCAGGPLAAQKPQKPPQARGDVITAKQIRENPSFRTAYDAVEALRGSWLIARPDMHLSGEFAPNADGGLTRADTSRSGRGAQMNPQPSADIGDPPGVYAGVRVYVDGTYVGQPDELKNIPVQEVVSISRYTGNEATALFGAGNSPGVIAVSTHGN